MAQPPAGSSLLFGALADSGKIKQRKNGSFQMEMEGVESINWFTDRPQRAEGTWKPQKLLRKWDKYFASSEPNAQATVEVGEEQQMATFEMFKPKIKSGKMIFNIKPLTDSGRDKLTGLQDIGLSDISLFIDDASTVPSTCNLTKADLTDAGLIDAELTGANLNGANLNGANLIEAHLTSADLTGANLTNANLGDADLFDADLNGANLNGAYLGFSSLSGANLSGANLGGADLFDASLLDATYDPKTTWPTAEYWNNTTCPDGTNSNNNPSCGF